MAPPLWVAQAVLEPSILIGEHSYWQLHAHPLTGYTESAVILPILLAKGFRWELQLLPWVVHAVLVVMSVVVLAVMARVLLAAASRARREEASGGQA